MRTTRKAAAAIVAALTTSIATACGADGDAESGDATTLRLALQYSETDYRGVLAQQFADKVEELTDGDVTFRLYFSSSLMEPTEMFNAMQGGGLDAAVLPLDYASGDVPQFSMAIMPAVVRNYTQAENWETSGMGERIQSIAEENGISIVTWNWGGGGFGVKGGPPVVVPNDVQKGMTARGAGPYAEDLLERAGYSITSMPSSDIYNGLQTGVIDAVVTTPSSFCSFKLEEQIDSYTSPAEGSSWWFTLHPLVVSTSTMEKLTDEQQDAIREAGKSQQEFAYQTPPENDAECEKTMRDAGVEVATIGDDQFDEWQEFAQPTWQRFAEEVEGGQELIDLALAVPQD